MNENQLDIVRIGSETLTSQSRLYLINCVQVLKVVVGDAHPTILFAIVTRLYQIRKCLLQIVYSS